MSLCSDLKVHGDRRPCPLLLVIRWQELNLCTDLRLLHPGHALDPATQGMNTPSELYLLQPDEPVKEVTAQTTTPSFSPLGEKWRKTQDDELCSLSDLCLADVAAAAEASGVDGGECVR